MLPLNGEVTEWPVSLSQTGTCMLPEPSAEEQNRLEVWG